MERSLKFIKESNGLWFIDLPEWTGAKGDLQMVLGADTLLDMIAEGKNEVALRFSDKSFEGADYISWYADGLDGDASHGGASYLIKEYNGKATRFEIWLCHVTKFIFGEMPDIIFFKKVFITKVSEIIKLKERLYEINQQPLESIDFLDDNGNRIEIDKRHVHDFKFTGLNNSDFIATNFYKEGFRTEKFSE